MGRKRKKEEGKISVKMPLLTLTLGASMMWVLIGIVGMFSAVASLLASLLAVKLRGLFIPFLAFLITLWFTKGSSKLWFVPFLVMAIVWIYIKGVSLVSGYELAGVDTYYFLSSRMIPFVVAAALYNAWLALHLYRKGENKALGAQLLGLGLILYLLLR